LPFHTNLSNGEIEQVCAALSASIDESVNARR
jgi:hypothetical protein